jgi:O-antigen/teichoic acid export membrane protein
MVKVGWGVSGAVLATIFAQLVSTTSLLVSARDNFVAHFEKIHIKTTLRDVALSIAAVGGFTALSGVDTFLARHYLSNHVAGIYAAGAIAAHISLFAPMVIVSVAFPHLVENDHHQSRKAFVQALWMTFTIGVVTAIFLTAFSTFVVSVLFGSKYSDSIHILGILSFTSVFFGLINLLVYLLIARRSLMALLPWLGVGGAVAAIGMSHTALNSVAWSMFCVGLLTFAACFSAVLGTMKSSSTKVFADA